jgi:hypothetical protein
MMIDELSVLLQETEAVCAKLQDGAQLCGDDIDKLQGCLQNWKDVQDYSAAEQKRKRNANKQNKKENTQRKGESNKKRYFLSFNYMHAAIAIKHFTMMNLKNNFILF